MRTGTVFGGALFLVFAVWAFWIAVIVSVLYLIFHPALIGEWIGAIKAGIN